MHVPLLTAPSLELCARSGDEVIHDRLAFAGSSWKPLLQLRDAWAAEASTWLSQWAQLKRAYDRELEATRAAEARAAAARPRGGGGGEGPPAKRMRVRSAQVARDKYPGSLTVNPGDLCIFVQSCTNPLWSTVKMDDDGRVGKVSASRLEELPDEAEADPTDDEGEAEPDPTDDEAEAVAEDEEARVQQDAAFAQRTREDEASRAEADAAECGYD